MDMLQTLIHLPLQLAVSALVLALGGLSGFGYMSVRGLRRRRKLRASQQRFRPRMTRTTIGSLVSLLLLSGAGTLFSLALFVQTYTAFTARTRIAHVETRPATSPGSDFELILTEYIDGDTREQIFPIRGNQWTVEGNILVWAPELTVLGLRPCYKLTRVRGRFLNAELEAATPPTVHALTDEEHDRVWLQLIASGRVAPWVDAVFGTSVTQMPRGEYDIYVTPTGLLVQPSDAPGDPE